MRTFPKHMYNDTKPFLKYLKITSSTSCAEAILVTLNRLKVEENALAWGGVNYTTPCIFTRTQMMI